MIHSVCLHCLPNARSKVLWLDAFLHMSHILSAKELSELADMLREKGLRARSDVFEILLQDEDAGQ